jgi:NADH:ubiquinone oxidoreductase subunit E
MSLKFSAEATNKLEVLYGRYPSKQPVILAALHLAQKEFGDLRDEVIDVVSEALDLPKAHVFGVVTFYTMFRRKAGGTTTVRICTNVSCMLRGGYDVLEAFEDKLGLKRGESNDQFSIVEEECLAACANAPAVICGTKYFLDVTPEQVDDIVTFLKSNPHPESEVV